MVHKHRSAHKAANAKDISPTRNMSAYKSYKLSASPSNGSGFGLKLSVPVAVPSAPAAAANKWHYNDMVNNNRQQFNNLHFC